VLERLPGFATAYTLAASRTSTKTTGPDVFPTISCRARRSGTASGPGGHGGSGAADGDALPFEEYDQPAEDEAHVIPAELTLGEEHLRRCEYLRRQGAPVSSL